MGWLGMMGVEMGAQGALTWPVLNRSAVDGGGVGAGHGDLKTRRAALPGQGPECSRLGAGFGLPLALGCPWIWAAPGFGLTLAVDGPWLWTVPEPASDYR